MAAVHDGVGVKMARIAGQASTTAADAPSRLRVLLADEDPLIVAGIRRALERSEDIEVVGQARSGPEVMRMSTGGARDGLDGSTHARRERQRLHLTDPRHLAELKIVVLSACDDRPRSTEHSRRAQAPT
jgi:DNA-binding NarL/FixJ family response regulator